VSARRLPLVLALLAVALLVPTGLLVHRALRGAGAEQEERHRAVAERLFDEMERALSDLVTREEARPVESWRAASDLRLTELPEEPFVLGYFQVEPDGRVTAPLPARRDAALGVVTKWFTSRTRGAEAGDAEAKRARPPEQAPGTTVSLEKAETESLRALGDTAKSQAPSASPSSAYDALQSLNRGAEERSLRQRKMVAQRAEADVPAALHESAAPAAPMPVAPPEAAEGRREALADLRRDARAEVGHDGAAVAVDPLVGRLADARHLLLYRSVFAGAEALRQGLVLDVEDLAAHLRDRALGANRLPGALLSFSSEGGNDETPGAPDGARRYRHRFAEPFDAVTASVALAPLGGGSGAGVVYALAALLVVTGGVGLFAVHRMVTVAVGFAERRSNFVAAVSHELKTPLTAIRMYGEMLRDDLVPSDDKRREYYRTITVESERLSRLIDNVLEFSRLEKGTRSMRIVVGAVGPVVEEAAELLRPHAERTGFTLRTDVAPDLPPVRFERDALLQVLVNLVDNALNYAARATLREVAIECRRRGDGVVLCVRDRGPGVASRHLPRVFEAFYRGEDELVRETRGTGLGLALVKSLVERMGGTVGGRNAADGGFEVEIALPGASR
jgi:signal transduction histidine kinase